MSLFKDNSESIGHTPLIQINRLAQGRGERILAKIEGRNPAFRQRGDRLSAARLLRPLRIILVP